MKRIKALQLGAWFFFFNSFTMLLVALRFTKHITGIEGFVAFVYVVFSTLSHFTILTFIPYLFLYIPMALLFPRKLLLQIWASLIVTSSLFVLVVDTFVFDLYRFHINRFTLELLFGGAGSDIFSFHSSQYILVISAVLVTLLFELFVFWRLLKFFENKTFRGGKWITIVVIVMMFSSHMMHAYASANGYRQITRMSKCYPLYYPATANRFMYRTGLAKPDQNREIINSAIIGEKGNLLYPLNPIVADSSANMNVLILLLDSWNTVSLDSIAMPGIWKFSKEALNFKNHYSGSNGTRTGVFSFFYGIPGLYWYDVLGSEIRPVLMDQFLDSGYKTEILASASLGSPPFDRTVFAGINNLKLHTPGKAAHDRDIQITNDWIKFIDQHTKSETTNPFLGFIFYDAMHSISHPAEFTGPFQPEARYAPYEKLGNESDAIPFLNLYKNVANFEDSLVNMVLMDLKKKELLDNTIVIITGDHSQEFNENKKGYWGHNGNYSAAQMNVPLIIHWPGKAPVEYNHWTSHYDLVPTLMRQLFHCKNEISDYSIGKSLFDQTEREWLLVGSHDNFGIIESDRITTIYFDRSFDITDRHLNVIEDAKLNAKLINEIMKRSNMYYPKNR